MQIDNLDVGLRKALRVTFVAAGLDESAANAKVELHIAAADELFKARLAQYKTGTGKPEDAKRAMLDVLAWARTL